MLRAIAGLTFLTACGAVNSQNNTSPIAPTAEGVVIAPDILDLPLLPGSMQCEDPEKYLETSRDVNPVACIKFRFDDPQADEMDWKYVAELRTLGWKFDGGAAIAYYLKRPVESDGCFEELSFINWADGDPTEIAKIGTSEERDVDWSKIPYGLILLYLSDSPNCGGAQ